MGPRHAFSGVTGSVLPAALRRDPRIVGTAWAAGFLLFVGLVADLIPNPVFLRMVPAYPWDYAFLLASSALVGVFMGLRRHYLNTDTGCGTAAGTGGAFGFLGVGCPICNKVVVALLGVSGALNIVEPLRPLLSAVGVLVLAASIGWLVRNHRDSPAPASGAEPS